MGFIAFLLMLWVICVLFPGGGGSYFDMREALACFAAGVIGFVLLIVWWGLGVAGFIWLGEQLSWNSGVTLVLALFGPIAIPMLGVSVLRSALEHRRAHAR